MPGPRSILNIINCISLSFLLCGTPLAWAKEIAVGGIFDLTGPTSDTCKDYYAGAMAATKHINERGGIAGDTIRLAAYDYSYRLHQTLSLTGDIGNIYSKIFYINKAAVILGWGPVDTNTLRTKIHKDRIVYFSAHFDSNYTDPRESPYNFFVGTDYSTSLRAALKFAKEQGAKRFVFIYPEHPYGKNPIPAGKEYAELIDLEVGPDQIVDLRAIDATSQLTYMKKFDPDFAWIGGTAASAAVILRDAAKLGLRTKFIVNCWGFDEDLLKLAGEAAEDRAFGVLPVAPWGAEVPGMKHILASAADPVHSSHYVKGWVAMLVIAEGLIRAHRSGAIDGTGIKNALETLTDFDTGGLTAPITFTSRDHRPNTSLSIYTVVKGLKMSKTQDIHLPRDPRQVGR